MRSSHPFGAARATAGSRVVWVGAFLVSGFSADALAQWPQWGGPNRNFTVRTASLAERWAENGPPRIWQRALGDGYSCLVYDDGVLYTMYRKSRTANEEFTIALDAKTGGTLWEHGHRSPLLSRDENGWGGQGPNATPLVVGGRLFTVGSRAMLHSFDKKTGEVLWERDLARAYGAPVSKEVGYPCSPIAYEGSIIVPLDRERPDNESDKPNARADGQTLAAFDQASGALLWKKLDYRLSEASPILIKFDGKDQLVCSTRHGLIGVDPKTGTPLWHHPEMGSIVTPVWNGRDLLFYTSGGNEAVGRVVRLVKKDGKTQPEEVWSNRKIKIWQPTPVCVNGYLYGSTERLLLAVDMQTGKRVWAKRGFPMAGCVYADGKLLVLDQDGQLTLATATPEGLRVHSQCKITERYSFSVPTLVDRVLYVRDRNHVLALDVG
ncbi:MAG: PQQ-like beta-propeller repeat protein [Phycisphaerae bacterium]|jgi:outer membrane protein assembly factor BamB